MKSYAVLFSLFIISTLGLFAVRPLFSSGSYEKTERSVGSFESVSFKTAGRIIIVQGRGEFLTIEAPRSVITRITTEVRRNTLEIGYRGLFRQKNGEPLIIIGMKDISGLSVSSTGSIEAEKIEADGLTVYSSGSGIIRVENLQADDLRVKISSSGHIKIGSVETETFSAEISSSGDLVLSGTADRMILNCSSSGSFDGTGFAVQEAVIHLSSSGSAVLRVEKHIEADISSSGILSYYGDPVLVQARQDSMDKVRRLEKIPD